MARRTSTADVKIFTFGFAAEHGRHIPRRESRKNEEFPGTELVHDQLYRGAHYYNELVDLEVARRKRFRQIRAEFVPGLTEAEAEAQALSSEIAAVREQQRVARKAAHSEKIDAASAKRKKRPPRAARAIDPGLGPQLALLRTRLKAAREKVAELRARFGIEKAEKEFDRRVAVISKSDEAKAAGRQVGPHVLAQAKAEVLEEMLKEPKWPEAWKEIARLNAEFSERVRAARHGCGTFPGTYLLVEEAFAASRRGLLDPERKRFEGEGRVGINVHKLPVKDLFNPPKDKPMLALDPLPPSQWSTRRGRGHAYTVARARLSGDSPPVELRVNMSRPLPPNGIVTRAWIKVSRVGRQARYELQLTVEAPNLFEAPSGEGVLALHLAWRRLPNQSLRVGYLFHELGTGRELVLPRELTDRYDQLEELRRVSDLHFNGARDVLIKLAKEGEAALPSWLSVSVKNAHVWRRHGRLVDITSELVEEVLGREQAQRLWAVWREERLRAQARHEPDEQSDLLAKPSACIEWGLARGLSEVAATVFWLETWRKKELHLQDWRASQSSAVRNHRKDLYRRLAKEASRGAQTLLFEKKVLDKLARRPLAEEKDPSWREARRQRVIAATSVLRQYMVERFGAQAKEAPSDSLHADCGGELESDPSSILLRCTACGSEVDRDENSCRRMIERFSGGEDPGGARNPEKPKDVEEKPAARSTRRGSKRRSLPTEDQHRSQTSS